jgi:hypothetical protein
MGVKWSQLHLPKQSTQDLPSLPQAHMNSKCQLPHFPCSWGGPVDRLSSG